LRLILINKTSGLPPARGKARLNNPNLERRSKHMLSNLKKDARIILGAALWVIIFIEYTYAIAMYLE
jgi:hypothetical protein